MPARKTTKTNKATTRKAASKKAPALTSAPKIAVPIYQIKVTLKESRPSIWRRIQVRSDATLGELHAIIQMVMGWSNSHLHHFIVGKSPNLRFIGAPSRNEGDDFMDEKNEDEIVISKVLSASKTKIVYEYDFGDSWEHEVVLEKILDADARAYHPRCIEGENACPPEDVGGVWGYVNFLQAINNPEHNQHEEFLDWVGGEFNPEEFDLRAVNELLKNRENFELYGRGII
ncbi:MAG TPA: plasmid pRiA4b ORF-3 family protein [Blastocatellia bacterium]|nr:plasmid pRiA4b ORF-3 family protein [Blastocatellia bacterium]